MDKLRWQQIQTVFHAAADLSNSEQRAFLESACENDGELFLEVTAMLNQDASGDSLLDHGLADAAQRTLEASGSGISRVFGA